MEAQQNEPQSQHNLRFVHYANNDGGDEVLNVITLEEPARFRRVSAKNLKPKAKREAIRNVHAKVSNPYLI